MFRNCKLQNFAIITFCKILMLAKVKNYKNYFFQKIFVLKKVLVNFFGRRKKTA